MNDVLTTAEDGPVDHPRRAAGLHTPVLLERCLDLLAPALIGPGAPASPILIDCTLGTGGHAEAALERFGDLAVDVFHSFGHAFAVVAFFIAVAQFHRFIGTG